VIMPYLAIPSFYVPRRHRWQGRTVRDISHIVADYG
jgi:hypothetical protein